MNSKMNKESVGSVLLSALLLLCSSFVLISCGSDDKDFDGNGTNSSSNSAWGKGTWYTFQSYIDGVSVKKSSFEEVEKAIDNEEILDVETAYLSNKKIYYYALRSNFVFSDGGFSTTGVTPGYRMGRLENIISGSIYYAIRIIDKNTLASCSFSLYVDEDMKTEFDFKKLATLFNGHIFKSVSLYLREYYYTYTKVDNKIVVSNGDIFTIIDGTLIKDGYSSPLVPFDPMKVYGITK